MIEDFKYIFIVFYYKDFFNGKIIVLDKNYPKQKCTMVSTQLKTVIISLNKISFSLH
jgi:hypothetical protein